MTDTLVERLQNEVREYDCLAADPDEWPCAIARKALQATQSNEGE